MPTLCKLILTVALLVVLASPVSAQTDEDYHPFLSDKFNLELGVFWPQIDFGARIDGTTPEDEIDFDQALNLNDNQSAASINFRWRFGKKWSVWGQYWSTDNSGEAVLEEDIEWGDIVYEEGTFAKAAVGLDIARVFVGRQFDMDPKHEFGIGAGLHLMNIDTFLEGEALINDNTTEFHRATASASIPLPNVGVWYMYSWSPKWMFNSRLDWLSVTIGDYSGSLFDAQVGINYQAFKNIGFGVYYKGFTLDADIDKSDWSGTVDISQRGPLLTVTATW